MEAAYKLHVVQEGKGRPVILVHGGFSSHRYWNDVAEQLRASRKLYKPDLLGFGKSPKPRKAAYTVPQFVACLRHTFEDIDFTEPPVLVGHSFGALIALEWALQEPQKFSALVLSAPVMFEESKAHQQLASIARGDKEVTSKVYSRLIISGMGWGAYVPTRIGAKVIKGKPRHVAEDIASHKRHVFRKMMKSDRFIARVVEDLSKVSMPTKVLMGTGDITNRHAIDDVAGICKSNKNCRLQVLRTGHNIPLEHPETLVKAILSV